MHAGLEFPFSEKKKVIMWQREHYSPKLEHLVFHQRNERRDDKANPVYINRWILEAQALSIA